jgi:hypothetical protein
MRTFVASSEPQTVHIAERLIENSVALRDDLLSRANAKLRATDHPASQYLCQPLFQPPKRAMALTERHLPLHA